MTAPADPRADWLAALAWQIELGADEAIGEAPADRFAESAAVGPAGGQHGGAAAPGSGGLPGGTAAPPPRPSPGRGEGFARGEASPERDTTVPAPAAASADPDGQAAADPGGPAGRADAAGGARAAPPAADFARDGLAGGVALPPEAEDARTLAEAAQTLEELAQAMRDWTGSPLREAARNAVFCDGLAGARLMVIGEAPGAEEDRVGRPFVGRAGQMLDRMLAAIGLARTAPAPESAVYITNMLPWRPPGNRTPTEAEARAFLPFVERHIALAAPDVLLLVGNTPTKALLGTATGIRRMRGTWARHGASGLPVMPTYHPAYLLRTPEEKRLAWHDLLAVRRALDGG